MILPTKYLNLYLIRFRKHRLSFEIVKQRKCIRSVCDNANSRGCVTLIIIVADAIDVKDVHYYYHKWYVLL